MAASVVIEGDVATVRMRLSETAGAERNGFAELLGEKPGTRSPEEYRKRLETELEAEAKAVFAAAKADVAGLEVSVTCWRRGSLELAALVTAAKVVIDVAALLEALRTLREAFPRVTARLVESWVSRDVRPDLATVEMGDDLLLASVDDEPATAKETPEFSLGELAAHAGLALAVLGLTVLAVVIGVNNLS